MNTIYDGSFVLGQTSATNFVGGIGITVDSPSEGTVRISNDETVLFETTALNGSGSITLSEPFTNFERVMVLPTRGYPGRGGVNAGGTGPWNIYETSALVPGSNAYYYSIAPYIMEGHDWKLSVFTANEAATTLNWTYGFQRNMITGTAGTTANSFTGCVGIRKVIGINRKEV